MAARDMVGNGAAGVFHELDAGNPAGDRQPIRLRHFCGRQQFGRQQFHVAARCILTCPQIPARRFTHLITEWAGCSIIVQWPSRPPSNRVVRT
jgi:hypothetical protein